MSNDKCSMNKTVLGRVSKIILYDSKKKFNWIKEKYVCKNKLSEGKVEGCMDDQITRWRGSSRVEPLIVYLKT